MTASALNVMNFVRPVEKMAVKNVLRSTSLTKKQDSALHVVLVVMNVPQRPSAQSVSINGLLIKLELVSNVISIVKSAVNKAVRNVKTHSILILTQDYVIDAVMPFSIVLSVLMVPLVLNVKLLSSLKMKLVKLVVKPVQPVKIEMLVLPARTRTVKTVVQMPVLNVLMISSI